MTAAQIIETCSVAIVAIGVLLVATRSIARSIWLLAAQGALVGLAALGVGLTEGVDHLVVGGSLALVAKAVVVPAVLFAMLRTTPVRVERHPYLGPRAGLAVAVLIVFVAQAAVSGVSLPVEAAGERALPAAIAEVLTGLLLVMTRRKAVSLLIGLFVFENGLAIVAFALTFGMPLVVEMGILFDLLIAVGVGWITTRRMIAVTGTASTDELRRLRG
jgi:hydrogenase-4 component E